MLQPVTTFDRQVTLRSADNNDLFISRSRLRLRAFCIAAPRARNSLPSDVKSADTVKTFEKRLKILLFSKHYFHSHLIAILCFMLYFASILQLVGTCCKLPCLDMIWYDIIWWYDLMFKTTFNRTLRIPLWLDYYTLSHDDLDFTVSVNGQMCFRRRPTQRLLPLRNVVGIPHSSISIRWTPGSHVVNTEWCLQCRLLTVDRKFHCVCCRVNGTVYLISLRRIYSG